MFFKKMLLNIVVLYGLFLSSFYIYSTERLDQRVIQGNVFSAISMNNYSLLSHFLGKLNDINCRDFSGLTPLMCATIEVNLEMVDMLLQYRADVNALSILSKKSALTYLSDKVAIESVKKNSSLDRKKAFSILNRLFDAGAHPDRSGTKNLTALMCAAKYGDCELMALLLRQGAKVPTYKEVRESFYGVIDRQILKEMRLFIVRIALPAISSLDSQGLPDDIIISSLVGVYGKQMRSPKMVKLVQGALKRIRGIRAAKKIVSD